MNIGRRPLFFASLALISLLLLEPTPPDLRWVNLAAAALAMFWAVALFFEERSMLRWRPQMRERAKPASPGDETKDEGDDRATRA